MWRLNHTSNSLEAFATDLQHHSSDGGNSGQAKSPFENQYCKLYKVVFNSDLECFHSRCAKSSERLCCLQSTRRRNEGEHIKCLFIRQLFAISARQLGEQTTGQPGILLAILGEAAGYEEPRNPSSDGQWQKGHPQKAYKCYW